MSSEGHCEGFTTIGKDVYIKRGQKRAATSAQLELKNPTIILIFGWMGAQLPHLYKYTKIYDGLYPEATQILIRCHPSFFWSTENYRQASLTPVVEVLEALGCVPPARKNLADCEHVHMQPMTLFSPQPRILVHAFSNGGAYQLVTLSKLLSSQTMMTGSKSPRRTCAIILDSCPGDGGVVSTRRAFLSSIRNKLVRIIAGLFISILYYTLAIISHIFGRKTPAQVLKTSLNNPRLLPWVDERTPRLYIYSKKDELVPWQQVEEHAGEAKALGIDVNAEVFTKSPHVAHARADPAKYWAAMGQVWATACKMED